MVDDATILDKFRLDGQLAVVTGCSRGIGKAIAIGLAQAGADIVGASRSLAASGSDVEKEVLRCGRRFHAFRCDFGKRESVREFASTLANRFPYIDVLINNAGTILRKPAAEHPDAYWDEVIETNVSSQFILTREIGKRMLERGRGKIVFISSLLAFQGGLNVPGYSASKGALAQLTKALANEWASRGVNVNAIAPGYIETENTAPLRADPERSAAILSRIPAGRWGQPEDLQGAALFLASAASDFVNGSVLVVDGGWLGR